MEIKPVYYPSLSKIDKKFLQPLEKVSNWFECIGAVYAVTDYSLYVRGSAAHGAINKFSDLDIAILLPKTSLSTLLKTEKTIDAFLELYLYPFAIDVKVYATDKEYAVEPAVSLSSSLKKEIKRHLNFDFSANGICIKGFKTKNYLKAFESEKDFIQNNHLIMGVSILQMLYEMKETSYFNMYYKLIKYCIKLASLNDFKEEKGYFFPLPDCFENALNRYPLIKKDLVSLYQCLELDFSKIDAEELEGVKKSLEKVASVILSPLEKRNDI
jgi:predicted nucleotidyltransferase